MPLTAPASAVSGCADQLVPPPTLEIWRPATRTWRAFLLGLHQQVCSSLVTVLSGFCLVVVLGVALFGLRKDRVRALFHHLFRSPRVRSWLIVHRVCEFFSTQVPPASGFAETVGCQATICGAARS